MLCAKKAIFEGCSTEVIVNGKEMTIKEFYRKHHKRGKKGKVRMGMRQKELRKS